LVAPLDWGLGHATRCIPIIRCLLGHGANPVIAADKGPLALLHCEFPDLEQVHLPGRTVRYSEGNNQLRPLVAQFPALLASIAAEGRRTRSIIRDLDVAATISDQRFGVRGKVPSVLITHQLHPRLPALQGTLRTLNHALTDRFDRCWLMDEQAVPGLAGELSHPARANCRYIGIHSRLNANGQGSERFRIVAVVSGPEPQRTLFEQALLHQLQHIPGDHLLVQGMPEKPGEYRQGNVLCRAHMGTVELASALCAAEMVVMRSGYTSLMDLHRLGRRAVLVPTPGQPEQEYLADLHAGTHLVQQQASMDLASALAGMARGTEVHTSSSDTLLDEAVKDLLQLIG
jgi:hypothetical protein